MFHRRILQERQGSFASSVFDHFKFYFLTCASASFGLNALWQPLKGCQVPYTTIAPCCTCCILGPECLVKTAVMQHCGDASRNPTHSLVVSFVKSAGPQESGCDNLNIVVIETHVRRHCCHNHGNAPRGHKGCQAMAFLSAAIVVLLGSVLRANLTSTRQPWQWAFLCSTANPVCLLMAVNTTGMPPRPRSLMMMIVFITVKVV